MSLRLNANLTRSKQPVAKAHPRPVVSGRQVSKESTCDVAEVKARPRWAPAAGQLPPMTLNASLPTGKSP
jgi:hypothetical protein